ncbi:hypothetical protein ACP70R_031396 [Stipagrostis hirtigluma subsp. patula]
MVAAAASARIAITCSSATASPPPARPLRVAVVGGGPAGATAAEALASAGAQAFLVERSPAGAKPCGGAIPLCMLDEFAIPRDLVDRRVTRMRVVSPSNLAADFSRALPPGAHIPMLRREVLESFLRRRAADARATLLPGLVTSLSLPAGPADPYLVHYISSSEGPGSRGVLEVDAIVGADGANSRVAREVGAGGYTTAIAFQERVRLPDAAMAYYDDLAEMYVGGDVSPDFYGWVFPKCDHVAVGTGTVAAKPDIKRLQSGIRAREALVEMCADEYVQRRTFESYLYKRMVPCSSYYRKSEPITGPNDTSPTSSVPV